VVSGKGAKADDRCLTFFSFLTIIGRFLQKDSTIFPGLPQ
jgi:hypothetical protein